MADDNRRTVDAVRTACEVLDVLQRRERVGVTEIAEEVGLAKGAVHRHLTTLDEAEYVVNEDGHYRLSLRYLDMADRVKEMIGNYDVIAGELEKLAETTGEVAQFATEEHGWVTYVYKANSGSGVQTASSAGKREYMHSTALGKAMLAEMNDERVTEILDEHGTPPKTEHTCTDPSELQASLETVRERGYSLDNQENITGLRCMGMPLMNDEPRVFGAVSISGPVSRMTDERIESELSEALARSTNVIEINSKFA
ncbi:transcriptional regulator, IclR family [Halarchaeum acidiphilum MH1-52-1]|uniref:Transcriptional regulator, IclR family n=1 Tax=Halarchaeum acidiphilum MH1-52-1 TaxID=1261545 RepID=U2YU20_9EURY|nr:IclR family transcriptional regulator [Halarchaeum acidiphilum]GAD52505.1 transcriptional regulator, IclR family [Halarchaeum acidiphilum MH1-52-1]